MNIRLFICCIVCFLLISCSSGLTPEQIQDRLIKANSNLNSYSIEMRMDMNIETDYMGKIMDVTSIVISEGLFDRQNKKMVMKGTVTSRSEDVQTDMETEAYIMDNFLYSKTMDIWMKMEMSNSIWSQQDQIEQTLELIKSGDLELLDEEKIDGKEYYVAKLNPDIKKILEIAFKNQEQQLSQLETDFEDMIEKYSATIWVNKDTFIIEKSRVEMTMNVESEEVAGDQSSGHMELDSVVESKISNINLPVEITLPKEAENAQDLSELQESILTMNAK